MSPHSQIEIEYLNGMHVVDSILWLDAPRQTDLCFISHAHVNPLGPYRKILMTPATAALLGQKTAKEKTLVCPYRQKFSLGEMNLELFPAGHMLGSAQIQVSTPSCKLVYTGDFQLQTSRTTESAEILDASVLVLEATYGLSHQIFPPRQEVEEKIMHWVNQALNDGQHPVFLMSPTGKAQELCKLFMEHGLSVGAHHSIFRFCKIYQDLGVPMSNVRSLRWPHRKADVVMFPSGCTPQEVLSKVKKARIAMVGGMAILPDATRRFQVDAVFPISGHADHPSLLRYIRQSGAKKIFLVRGACEPLASQLREKGYNAWPLRPPEQQNLFSSS